MGSSMMYVKGIWINQWTTKVNTQMGPGREFDDFFAQDRQFDRGTTAAPL